jgi:hypothetical protein
MQAVVPPPDGGYADFNTAEGTNALKNLSTGVANAAVGWFSLFSNTDGSYNTATGAGTLLFNIGNQNTGEGLKNTAVGTAALLFNSTGESNTAVGAVSLLNNTNGTANTAVGANALTSNLDGNFNTAVGDAALRANTSGTENTAVGQAALNSNTEGDFNTAIGTNALHSNHTGTNNIAIGHVALANNDDGNDNVGIGESALFDNTTGGFNTAMGYNAGSNATGSGNVYIGASMIGVAGENNHTYIKNIQNTIVSGGGTDFVSIDLTTGLLGHVSSSRRYKEEIKAMDKSSETLYRLNPVTYRFKREIDPSQTVEYGLVAEEVADADPNLAVRDAKGQIESVRYAAINAMLLNEFLKEHRKNEEQQCKLHEQEVMIARQQKQIEAVTATVQKVSAQLEVSKPRPQVVENDQ